MAEFYGWKVVYVINLRTSTSTRERGGLEGVEGRELAVQLSINFVHSDTACIVL